MPNNKQPDAALLIADALRHGLTANNLLGDIFGVPETLQSVAMAHEKAMCEAAATIKEGLDNLADAIRQARPRCEGVIMTPSRLIFCGRASVGCLPVRYSETEAL